MVQRDFWIRVRGPGPRPCTDPAWVSAAAEPVRDAGEVGVDLGEGAVLGRALEGHLEHLEPCGGRGARLPKQPLGLLALVMNGLPT